MWSTKSRSRSGAEGHPELRADCRLGRGLGAALQLPPLIELHQPQVGGRVIGGRGPGRPCQVVRQKALHSQVPVLRLRVPNEPARSRRAELGLTAIVRHMAEHPESARPHPVLPGRHTEQRSARSALPGQGQWHSAGHRSQYLCHSQACAILVLPVQPCMRQMHCASA